jgi:hypothetical protein
MRQADAGSPIIEVGHFALISRVPSAQCASFWMGRQRPGPVVAEQYRLTLPNVFELRRRLRSPSTRMVFVHAPDQRRPRRLHTLTRMVSGDFGALAFREAITAPHCPVIGLDFSDATELSDPALDLLERSLVFFKRELPADTHRLLPSSASPIQRRALERNLHKLRPASLGLGAGRLANLPVHREEKTHDVFFAGAVNSDVRRGELPLLETLRASGVRVCQPASHLPHQEFLRMCARSWLVWSPEGLGWDCFRHYEAAAAGSVPVINVPSITCDRPLMHGQHAIYYASECRDPSRIHGDFRHITDGLVPTVLQALKDRASLAAMGQEARAFVLREHTHEALVRRLMETAAAYLAEAPGPGRSAPGGRV